MRTPSLSRSRLFWDSRELYGPGDFGVAADRHDTNDISGSAEDVASLGGSDERLLTTA